MPERDVSDAAPNSLAGLIDFGREDALWTVRDLESILQHQLDAEIDFDLTRFGASRAEDLRQQMGSVEGPAIRTFRDLLAHPSPPVDLLDATRRFAKSCRSRADGPLPEEIATVLYFASAVAAMVKCGRRISRLDDEGLCYALDWALEQPWLDASLRDLFERGRQTLKPTGPDGDV
jgi:hypothetical protein